MGVVSLGCNELMGVVSLEGGLINGCGLAGWVGVRVISGWSLTGKWIN